MAELNISKGARKALAVASIIIGGFSAALPSPYANYGIALATALNAASLYLLREETPSAAPASEKDT